jgi:hypothetical protein
MGDSGHSFLRSLSDKTVCVLPDDIEGLDAACKVSHAFVIVSIQTFRVDLRWVCL